MIIGTGSDIVDIRRIEKFITRYGARFINRIYTDGEQEKAQSRADPIPTYAKRFAAKEACSKALGTGLSQGVHWRDMEITNLPTGQPNLQLSGGALKRLESLIPPGHTPRIHLTITDDYPWAHAHVMIEALL